MVSNILKKVLQYVISTNSLQKLKNATIQWPIFKPLVLYNDQI